MFMMYEKPKVKQQKQSVPPNFCNRLDKWAKLEQNSKISY